MKFGEALEEVKKGALIARAGWKRDVRIPAPGRLVVY